MKSNYNLLNWLIWIVFGSVVLYVVLTQIELKNQRQENSVYTIGKVVGKSKVARGEMYVDYTYSVKGTPYKGSVSISFCLECRDSCCEIGRSVKVRYVAANPSNSDLVH